MRIIEFYIMRRIFALFAAALVWVLALAWTTQVLNRIDLVTDNGQSVATFFGAAALVLPPVIPVVMPFAIGIAVAQTLATMNADSELVVINAAGSPRSTVIRPVLLLAIAASVAAFLINNTVEPLSRQSFRELLSNARADLLTTLLQEGSFQKIEDGLFVQVSERLPNGQLGGIFVADSREKGTKLVYHAQRGATVNRERGSVLVMQDGVVQRQSADGDVSSIRFDSYAFDLSQFAASGGEPTYYAKDRSLGFLLDPDPDDPTYKSHPQSFSGELHARFSEWLYPLVFALIGIAVAGDARSFREARLHPMITTMGIALLVRWAGFYAANEAETNAAFNGVLYAVPLTAIAVTTFFIATNRVMELPVSWTETVTTGMQKITETFTRLRIRLSGFRRPPSRGRA